MPVDSRVVPKYTIRAYKVDGPVFYKHEDQMVQAVSLDVEEHPDQPEVFTMEVVTACKQIITYNSHNYDTWPLAARRLFRLHTLERDRHA